MDCQRFENLLDQRLDERLDPRCPELEAHAADCATCRLHLQDAVWLLTGVAGWRLGLPAMSPESITRIVSQLVDLEIKDREVLKLPVSVDSRYGQAGWQSWAMLAGTVAAMWLVFAGSSFQEPTRTQRDLARNANSKPVVTPQVDLETVIVSASGAYSHVANDSYAAAQDFALLWPASHGATESPSTVTTPADNDTGSKSNWPDGLSPVGDSVKDAWKFLQRTVPHIEKSAS